MMRVNSLYKMQILNLIKKINNSDISTNLHKKVILINKETINDNHGKGNAQRSNQKLIKYRNK